MIDSARAKRALVRLPHQLTQTPHDSACIANALLEVL